MSNGQELHFRDLEYVVGTVEFLLERLGDSKCGDVDKQIRIEIQTLLESLRRLALEKQNDSLKKNQEKRDNQSSRQEGE